jgi:hypothetical protein
LVQAVQVQQVTMTQGEAEQRQDLLTRQTAVAVVAELKWVATVQAVAVAAIEAAAAQVFQVKVMQAVHLALQAAAAVAVAVR